MLTNAQFFGFLMANIFWSITFFASVLFGMVLVCVIAQVKDWGEGITVFLAGVLLFAFGVAGLCLMIGRVWPTWG